LAAAIFIAIINFYKMKEIGRKILVIINWTWMIAMITTGLMMPISVWIITKQLHFSVALILPMFLFLVPALPAYILNGYLNQKNLIKLMK